MLLISEFLIKRLPSPMRYDSNWSSFHRFYNGHYPIVTERFSSVMKLKVFYKTCRLTQHFFRPLIFFLAQRSRSRLFLIVKNFSDYYKLVMVNIFYLSPSHSRWNSSKNFSMNWCRCLANRFPSFVFIIESSKSNFS